MYSLVNYVYRRGTQKNSELSSGGGALVVQAPLLGECSRNPCVSVYQWCGCERLCSASVNFFEASFSVFSHFMMGDLRVHLDTSR